MPPARAVYLRDHPELREHLLMDLTGEARAAYSYCRNGKVDAVREYLTTRLGDKLFVIDAQNALSAGLFGTGNASPQVKHRIGDLIALLRGNSYFGKRNDKKEMLGQHGGLTEKEMLVPLIAARLDT